MACIELRKVTKTFRLDSEFLSRRFRSAAAPPIIQEPDSPAEVIDVPDSRVTALDEVNLRIEDGETMTVLGPSGSGKSTLLRVVAGLEEPDSGTVLYDGIDMTNMPPKERNIGMVFQNYALYPHMESQENIGFFLLIRRRKKEIPERVRITAEIMGVDFSRLLERKPKQLSGGEQQRVAIARCISRNPTLFLLDEPLSNLDAKLRSRTRVEIKKLLQRFTITTLYVTHDQTEAIALGDRITIMNRGRIEQTGTYRELISFPANSFVASFLGSPPMNLLHAQIDLSGRIIRMNEMQVTLPANWIGTEGQRVLLGIRPDDVTLAKNKPDVTLEADVIEPLVQERSQLVHGFIAGQAFVAKLNAEQPVHRGDRVPLEIIPERLHLFDRETTKRLQQRD